MNPTTHTHHTKRLRAALLTAGLLAGAGPLAACGSSSSSTPTTQAATTPTGGSSASTPADTTGATTAVPPAGTDAGTTAPAGGPVLPVADNPISNTSTVQELKIDSVLVENNVDSSGKAASDHLEIALTNTGTTELTAFEVFYTFTDPTTNVTENYYAQLPADFTIPAGGQRTAHFDNTGQPDHFPVNEFSLYYTDTNTLDVTVTVSATDAAIQTTTLQKDAGGAETAD
jgi:hypothetical protein